MVEMAIVDSNILTCIGLRQMLREMLPMAGICVIRSFNELCESSPERFMHFFVSSAIYFEHAQFFISQPHRSIVLVYGDNHPYPSGLITLNVCQGEAEMAKSLLRLQRMGHPGGQKPTAPQSAAAQVLSSRETEVAVLLAKGYINKEVADRLNISLTTAISHRKNIMAKLKAHSLADIIIYVAMNGLINVDEL